MSIFNSDNPTLTEKIFQKSRYTEATGAMSLRGTMNKFGFLILLIIASALFTWQLFYTGQMSMVTTLMMVGGIGGFIVALIITFKLNWAGYLAPIYALLEGAFLGGISATINSMFAESYPNIVLQAIGLTFGVALAMFLLYNFRIIKVTQKFRSILLMSTMGIALFYLITMVLGLFGVQMSFMNFGDNSLLGIGISLFVVAIAALNLLLNFDMIEQGAAQGLPKYMEWYCAFGLITTLVWLYFEILKLLSRFANNKN